MTARPRPHAAPGSAVRRAILALALTALVMFPASLAAQTDARLSNVFVDTDLRLALQDIAVQAGVTIVPDPTVSGLVTAEFTDATLEEALRIVLAGSGYLFQRLDDVYLVFAPDEGSSAFLETSRIERIKVDHLSAADARSLLATPLQRFVRVDEDANALLVTASPEIVERVRRDLAVVDAPRAHVLLDVQVVALEEGDIFALGAEWTMPTLSAGLFTNAQQLLAGGAPFPWAVSVGYTPDEEFTNALRLALDLREQNDEASILSNPQLLGRDGEQAQIRVTTVEYFEIVAGDDANARAQLDEIETGTVLTITPRVGADGTITLELEVAVSDVVSRGEQNLPVVSRREATTTVAIASGGTVAIGGLVDSGFQSTRRGLPLLSRIPIVGRLFGSASTRATNRQVAVLVTASVLADPAAAAGSGAVPRTAPAAPSPGGPTVRGAPVDEARFRDELRRILGLDGGEEATP